MKEVTSLPLAVVVAPGPVAIAPVLSSMMTMVTSLSLGLPLAVVVASGPVSPVAIAPPLSMVTMMTSLGISVPLSVKAKTIGQGIPVASVVGISISLGIGLSSSSGLGLGLPLAVISSGPVSTLVTSAMAVVVIVARLSEGDTGEEDGGDNKEFHDETSYQQ